MRHFLLLAFNLICSVAWCFPQSDTKLYFEHLDISNGLSQNTVLSILQDRSGFMWFGTRDGLNRYDGIQFKVFKQVADEGKHLGYNTINALHEDNEGSIWVGTDAGIFIYSPKTELFQFFNLPAQNGTVIELPVYRFMPYNGLLWITVEKHGLFCYNPNDKSLKHFETMTYNNTKANVVGLLVDQNNTIWFSLYEKGLYTSTDNLESFSPYKDNKGKSYFENHNISSLIFDADNTILVGTVQQGLYRINVNNNEVESLADNIFVRNLMLKSADEIWIGSESGLHIFNPYTKNKIQLTHTEGDKYSLADNAIYSIYKDRDEGVWIGTFFGGINYYPKQYCYFEKYYPLHAQNSIRGKRVREFCEDNSGNIWIGTEDAGLSKFDPKTKQFTNINHPNLYTNIHGLAVDDDNNLWIGTFSQGLAVMNLHTGAIKNYNKGVLMDDNVFSICKSKSGNMWLGTIRGVNLYKKDSREFVVVNELVGQFVFDIHEDYKGNMWFASYSNGLFCYNTLNNTWRNFKHDKNNGLPYDKIINIYEDSKNQLWFSMSNQGVCRFNPVDEHFETYLPNDVVYQVIEECDNIYWFTTNKGLFRFNAVLNTYENYTVSNGLLSNQFNYRSGLRLSSGQLYFGCIHGFISFDPKTFTAIKIPPAILTSFVVYGDKPIRYNINSGQTLKLNYTQNSFRFDFAVLSYTAPEANRYMYKLDGIDANWLPAGNEPVATYLNLNSGAYTFRVKVSNSGDEWIESEPVKIEITPPFWKSNYAYAFYGLLLVGFILFTMNYYRRKIATKQRQQIEALENEKEREIYHAKIEFFTTIAHEIRTPLSLIWAPLETLLANNNLDKEVKSNLEMMEQNTSRLLTLVNQLLDFRKTEVQGFSLSFINCNISNLLRDVYTQFKLAALQYKLSFDLELPLADFYAPVDKEAFVKIVSNLFSNALKHADKSINIRLQEDADNGRFSVILKNDGELIPADKKEEIFKAFFQLDNQPLLRSVGGTGIGLALARSLSELHGGKLYLDVNDKQYNKFCLYLPTHQDREIVLYNNPVAEEEILPVDSSLNQPLILIVEDHAEMRAFLAKQLKQNYSVLTAVNGNQAVDLLDRYPVNLVISDVVMPGINGFELCDKIKNDLNYSHIPVILLTAEASLQSKIKGIDLGADAYLEKPFSMEHLLARVAALLHNQEKLRRTFANSPFTESNTMGITPADKQFLEKLSEITHKELSNTDFNVDMLADSLNMSRSSLHRKIKGVSGLTPNDYIKLERLKKAAVLLKEKQYQVNEICYIVGFSSASYFAKCFQKQFGVLPKDFE